MGRKKLGICGRHKAEVEKIIQLLKDNPQGMTLYDISKAAGITSQLTKILVPDMYVYTDEVYMIGYVMYYPKHKRITLNMVFTHIDNKDNPLFLDYPKDKEVVKVVNFDYNDRHRDYDWRWHNEVKQILKKEVEYRQEILNMLKTSPDYPEKEIINRYGVWGRCALTTLRAYK